MSDLSTLFELQRGLQRKLGYDLPWMSHRERVDYVRWNILAATDELHEALAETQWKPWKKVPDDEPLIDHNRYTGELVDVLHFVINLFLVADLDADEVIAKYLAKHEVNNRRHETGVSLKCANPACRRALDEPGQPFQGRYINGLAWCDDGCYDAWHEQQDTLGSAT